jgi:hypothetical protein
MRETDRRAATADFAVFGDALSEALAEAEHDLFDLIQGADEEEVSAMADRVLIANGWPSRPHTIGAIQTKRTRVAELNGAAPAELYNLVRRALVEMARRRRDRLEGKPNGGYDPLFNGEAAHPVPPNGLGHADGGLTLAELTERFLAEKVSAMSAKTLIEYQALVRVLKEVWGEAMLVRQVTREHCRQVRDLFAARPSNWIKRFPRMNTAEHARVNGIEPMHPATSNKHVRQPSSVLRWGELEHYVDRNVAVGLTVSAPEGDPRDARRPLAPDQLRRIFDAPLYRGCQDDQSGYAVPGPYIIRRVGSGCSRSACSPGSTSVRRASFA